MGGVERVIEAHARKFADNGCGVGIITGKGGKFDRRVPVHTIPKMRSLHLVSGKVHEEVLSGRISPDFESLKQDIKNSLEPLLKKTDVCIIHNILTMHFNLALTAALYELIESSKKTRFISWVHDATFSDADYKQFWREDAPWKLLKTPHEKVKLVAISKYRRKKTASVFKIPPSTIEVVADGIDPVSFLKLKPATHFLFKKLKLYSADFIFLYPTRIVKRKNIEYAIRIISELNRKGKDARLLITSQPDPYNKGSMLYFKKLMKLASESGIRKKVVFASEAKDESGRPFRVDEHVLRDLYLLSDLLLFTSRSEGFGIPMLEAGICRLPIACTDIPPLREIGGEDVIYLNPENPVEDTADEISSYLLKTLPVPMFRKIFREYTWDAVFEHKIMPLMEELAG